MNRTVLIAGAGPAGLMLACELALLDVPVTIVERHAEPNTSSDGTTLHARSVELLEQRGLMHRFRADGVQVWPALHFGNLWLDMSDLLDEEYSLVAYQARVEGLLEQRARELGVDIRRGHELTGLAQDESAVTAVLRSQAGEYRLPAAYLVGCDGADSAVRELAGITAPATGLSWYGLLADVEGYAAEFEIGNYPGGIFAAITPGFGVYRLSTIEFDVTPPPDGTPVTLDELGESIRRVLGEDRPLAGTRPRYMSRYGNRTRLAEQYRSGRVFLVGDAAHVHFFPAGHGLNTALQDAVNLGWKLAAAVKGTASPELLDSYHAERHPVGERACRYGEAQMALLYPLDRVASLREVFSELMDLPEVNRHLVRAVTHVRYPMRYGRRRAATGGHPLLGARVPLLTLKTSTGVVEVANTLHGARGVLLDLSAGGLDLAEAAGWADRVDVVSAEPSPELDAVALLVRPDGHVAWVGTAQRGTEHLSDAMRTWFGEPASGDTAAAAPAADTAGAGR